MPLTPADIHNTAFKKPPIGKRGYDEEDVDAFLDELEQEMIRLIEENRALQQHVEQSGDAAPAPASPALGAQLRNVAAMLERAHEDRARAEQEARSMQARLEQARREQARDAAASTSVLVPTSTEGNSRVLMMAQRTADDYLRGARDEVDAVLATARDDSDQITADAQLKARTIEGDARRNHAEAMQSLESKRAALLDEIDRLGRLAQDYQAGLQNHVAKQLQDLDGVSEQA